MEKDIVSKLAELLSKGDLSEPETLYVLVQIRKLLEHSEKELRKNKKYSKLLFYCDWAVHAKLDRKSAKEVLQYLADHWRSDENIEFIGFVTFREELSALLKDFQLPTYIVTNHDFWFEFRNNLIQILIDNPLENYPRNTGTQIIKFSLQKGYIDYLLSYQAVFGNGETEKWNILLGDYGPRRDAILREEERSFLKKHIAKVNFRRRNAINKIEKK